MQDYLTVWWVWVCIALGVGILELLVPGFIFLGFALGALAMAGIVATVTLTNVPALLAIYAILSLVAWIALKAVFRKQSSGARVVTEDINDH